MLPVLSLVLSFLKKLNWKVVILAATLLTIAGGVWWVVLTIGSQRAQIIKLENQLERILEEGQQALPPVWTPPWWEGDVPWTPGAPTPTQIEYEQVVAEFRKELEEIADEKVFGAHPSTADIVEHRDALVTRYTLEFRRRLERRIDTEREASQRTDP